MKQHIEYQLDPDTLTETQREFSAQCGSTHTKIDTAINNLISSNLAERDKRNPTADPHENPRTLERLIATNNQALAAIRADSSRYFELAAEIRAYRDNGETRVKAIKIETYNQDAERAARFANYAIGLERKLNDEEDFLKKIRAPETLADPQSAATTPEAAPVQGTPGLRVPKFLEKIRELRKEIVGRIRPRP